jgi:hypothetical protein
MRSNRQESKVRVVSVLALGSLLLPAPLAAASDNRAGNLPTLGACVRTTVKAVTQRLEDGRTHRTIPDSGSAVELRNGVYGVSYDQVGAINESRAGDPVYTCLVKVPHNCPPGDNRGKLYTTTNLRTEQSWTLPDSEHSCGGA